MTLGTADIRAKIVAALASVAPELEPGTLAPNVDFREQLDLDSMDFLNFAIALSKSFGVDVPEADYRKLSTLDGCVAYFAVKAAA
jgi:acyl carrier protein